MNALQVRSYRKFGVEYERWQRDRRDWEASRIVTTALLLDMHPRDVTTMDIVWCHHEHGRPPLDDQAPSLRPDRRFRP